MWQKPLPHLPLSKPVFCRDLAIGFWEKEEKTKKKKRESGEEYSLFRKG
jgi:hypothetical protein